MYTNDPLGRRGRLSLIGGQGVSIISTALSHPDKPAAILAGSGASLSYGDLDRRSCQLARCLRDQGLRAGDRVALFMENNLDWFVAMWAARRSGLFFVPINWHLKPAEVRYVIENSDARALITSEQLERQARATIGGLEKVEVKLTVGAASGEFASLGQAIADYPSTPLEDERDGGSMPYSSGTSGKPKGILRALTNAPFGQPTGLERLLADLYGLTPGAIYLSPAPQYHAAPVGWTMAVQMMGGTVVVMETFEAEAVLRAIETYRVTHAQFVPTHFVRLLKLPPEVRERYDRTSLCVAVHAAAPCPPAVKSAMMAWWGPILFEYYGGSERCGLTAIGPDEWIRRPGSVGQARMGAVHIVDAESGAEAEPGTIGLVYFSGVDAFEYHKDPEKTRAARTVDGWGTYGDMGRVDEDGFLYLADRQSHVIISGGVNIYPQEIENLLVAHPKVSDVAVIGVPNEEFGEEVKAVVIPADGGEPGPVLAAELMAYCRSELAGFKRPRSIDFVDELPRHPNGKLLKRELRDQYWPTTAKG